jgi:hypothetical protein
MTRDQIDTAKKRRPNSDTKLENKFSSGTIRYLQLRGLIHRNQIRATMMEMIRKQTIT